MTVTSYEHHDVSNQQQLSKEIIKDTHYWPLLGESCLESANNIENIIMPWHICFVKNKAMTKDKNIVAGISVLFALICQLLIQFPPLIFSHFQNYWNTVYPVKRTFLFDRCPHSCVDTSQKEYDSVRPTDVFAKVEISAMEKWINKASITLTP